MRPRTSATAVRDRTAASPDQESSHFPKWKRFCRQKWNARKPNTKDGATIGNHSNHSSKFAIVSDPTFSAACEGSALGRAAAILSRSSLHRSSHSDDGANLSERHQSHPNSVIDEEAGAIQPRHSRHVRDAGIKPNLPHPIASPRLGPRNECDGVQGLLQHAAICVLLMLNEGT